GGNSFSTTLAKETYQKLNAVLAWNEKKYQLPLVINAEVLKSFEQNWYALFSQIDNENANPIIERIRNRKNHAQETQTEKRLMRRMAFYLYESGLFERGEI